VDLTDRVLADNAAYAAATQPLTERRPARRIAVVTCMDVRIEVHGALGLRSGDAHVLRNAGGVVTDDTLRSLVLSQWLLGTRSVLVVQHTNCALQGLHEPSFRQRLHHSLGQSPRWSVEAFTDLDTNVRESIRRVTASPYLRHRDRVYGFVLDVSTSRLRAVT